MSEPPGEEVMTGTPFPQAGPKTRLGSPAALRRQRPCQPAPLFQPAIIVEDPGGLDEDLDLTEASAAGGVRAAHGGDPVERAAGGVAVVRAMRERETTQQSERDARPAMTPA